MLRNDWDTALYEHKHDFVWKYGEELLKLLSPQSGDQILDLGCGTGQLTAKIADLGAIVAGIDADAKMINKAQENYPHLKFDVADATNFDVDVPVDAVFSNAVLHWIPQADAVIKCIYKALNSGGRFVAEFGAKGNIFQIIQALESTLTEIENPWYFPSVGEYTSKLEQHGFEVTYAILFNRPTNLADGEEGMANWLRMFGDRFFAGMSTVEINTAIQAVESLLKPNLYKYGTWIADYRRIRVVAIKL